MARTLLHQLNPLTGIAEALDGTIILLTDPGNARVLVFTLLAGPLIATVEHSGGVRGIVRFIACRSAAD